MALLLRTETARRRRLRRGARASVLLASLGAIGAPSGLARAADPAPPPGDVARSSPSSAQYALSEEVPYFRENEYPRYVITSAPSPRPAVSGDIYFTPYAGRPIGEPGPRLGEFYVRAVDYQAALVFLWPARSLHDILYTRATVDDLDDLGIARRGLCRFELGVGPGLALLADGSSATVLDVRFNAEILEVPALRFPGEPMGGTWSTLSLDANAGEGAPLSLRFIAKVAAGAYVQTRRAWGPDGRPDGVRLFVGGASGFDYAMHAFTRARNDQLAVFNAFGPTFDVWATASGLLVRGGIEAFGDFATVRSPAVERYLLERPPDAPRTVLSYATYYFALGATGRLRLSAEYRGLEIGGSLAADIFQSVGDPWQNVRSPPPGFTWVADGALRDPRSTDVRLTERAWITSTLPGGRVRIAWIDVERVVLTGAVGLTRARAADTRFFTRVSAVF